MEGYADYGDPHSFPTRRSSDLKSPRPRGATWSRPEPTTSSRASSGRPRRRHWRSCSPSLAFTCWRSEEHTSELQSHSDLVCRLLLEKKMSKGRVIGTVLIVVNS